MIIKTTINKLEDFKPWSGAVPWHKEICDAGKGEALIQALEELYPEGLTDGALNDLLWFEPK